MAIYEENGTGKVKRLHRLNNEQRTSIKKALGAKSGIGLDQKALATAIARYKEGDYSFDKAIFEQSVQNLDFNVMAGKDVCEKFQVKGYFVGPEVVRSVFDREYISAMERSPSHVIFLSPLVQFQKLVYLMMCRRCGADYAPDGPELYKVWPTAVDVRMPVLVCETENLIQDVVMSKIEPAGVNGWIVEGFSVVNHKIGMYGRAVVYRTPQRTAGRVEGTRAASL